MMLDVSRRAALLSLFILTACPPPPVEPPAAPRISGDTWTATLDGTTLVFARNTTTLVKLPFTAFQLGTVGSLDDNLSYDPYWLLIDDGVFTPTIPMGFAWRAPESAIAKQDGDALVLELTFNKNLRGTVRAKVNALRALELTFIPEGTSTVAMMRVKLEVDPDEGLYGLGEWFDAINHRGHLRPMQLEPDLNSESAATENHVAVPFLTGSRGWGVFFATNRHGVFDVAKTENTIVDVIFGTAEVSNAGLTFELYSRESPLDIVGDYFARTGAPRAPADWATGPWIWRNANDDQAEVEDDVRQIRALDLATSAIWIDRPYASEVNTFDFLPTQFPDAGGMVDTIHAAGLRLALWHTPYLAEGAEPFRTIALDAGYFPPGQGTWLNRWSSPLDVRNPSAVAFWKQNLQRYTSLGVEGFKLDFAEDIAAGVSGRRTMWRFFDGSTDRTMTDGYPREYHDMYRAVLDPNPGFMLVRAARWGEQTRGVIVWPGDIDATLTKYGESFVDRGGDTNVGVGGLPSAIRAGIGLAASGFPYFASDTGGYRHSPPDKETFIRWTEHAALMPVMQTGDSSSQPPWVYTPENGRDAEALELYRQFARLHLRLFPFFKSEQLASPNRPLVRAFGLQFPQFGKHPEDQYCLGESLLVAPVESKGAVMRSLIKPPGRWFDFDEGSELPGEAGSTVNVNAPLLKLPLFIREGALIAMLDPTIDTLSPTSDQSVRSFVNSAGALWVRAQPGEGSVTLFDGTVISQMSGSLIASAGSTFVTSVVWELRGVTTGMITHGGVAVPTVVDLDAASLGVVVNGNRVLIKTPLDGLPTQF